MLSCLAILLSFVSFSSSVFGDMANEALLPMEDRIESKGIGKSLNQAKQDASENLSLTIDSLKKNCEDHSGIFSSYSIPEFCAVAHGPGIYVCFKSALIFCNDEKKPIKLPFSWKDESSKNTYIFLRTPLTFTDAALGCKALSTSERKVVIASSFKRGCSFYESEEIALRVLSTVPKFLQNQKYRTACNENYKQGQPIVELNPVQMKINTPFVDQREKFPVLCQVR